MSGGGVAKTTPRTWASETPPTLDSIPGAIPQADDVVDRDHLRKL